MKHMLASLQHADPPGKIQALVGLCDCCLKAHASSTRWSPGGRRKTLRGVEHIYDAVSAKRCSRGGPAGTSHETHKKAGHLAPCSRARILFCGPAGGFLGRWSDFVRRRLPLRIENMWGIVPRQGTPQSWGHAQRPESYRGNPFLAVRVSPSWAGPRPHAQGRESEPKQRRIQMLIPDD